VRVGVAPSLYRFTRLDIQRNVPGLASYGFKEVLGPRDIRMPIELLLQRGVRLIAMNGSPREGSAGRKSEQTYVGTDVDDGVNLRPRRELPQAVAVVEEDFDEGNTLAVL
jgi:hypothetical protein